jgi:hypothetical protein
MTREVALTRGYVALVDDEDYARVAARRWQAVLGGGNVNRASSPDGRGGRVYLSRFLMAAPSGFVVDHINGDPLDNRRANLRLCSQGQNRRNSRRHRNNTTGFKGVCQRRARPGRWFAQITVERQTYFLGTFKTPEAAARAYDAAALEYHGEFARLNFPQIYEAAA